MTSKAAQDLQAGDRFRERIAGPEEVVTVKRVEAHPKVASIVLVTVRDAHGADRVLSLYRVNRRVIEP